MSDGIVDKYRGSSAIRLVSGPLLLAHSLRQHIYAVHDGSTDDERVFRRRQGQHTPAGTDYGSMSARR